MTNASIRAASSHGTHSQHTSSIETSSSAFFRIVNQCGAHENAHKQTIQTGIGYIRKQPGTVPG